MYNDIRHPGRGAARSGEPQTRDPRSIHCELGGYWIPGSALRAARNDN
jgi:hypothetical protein